MVNPKVIQCAKLWESECTNIVDTDNEPPLSRDVLKEDPIGKGAYP